jgi:hypothetical protein
MGGLVTENLHLSAYALANGAKLKAVSVSRTNGRRTVVFELEAAHTSTSWPTSTTARRRS